MKPKQLSRQRLFELCSYDAATGTLTWKVRASSHWLVHAWNARNAGRLVGSPDKHGYLSTSVDNRRYLVHHLVWLAERGELPPLPIDHIDGKPSNNRIGNLRAVPMSVNAKNQRIRSTNTSGVMGVTWAKKKAKWRAHITCDGASKTIGYFTDIEEAASARAVYAKKLGFHPNHGRLGVAS